MIIAKVPHRLSLLGSSCDMVPWVEAGNPSLVIGSPIDHFNYLFTRWLPPYFEYKTKLNYSQVENVTDHSKIKHRVIRAVLEYLKIDNGIELTNLVDIPGNSGTGSSSSFLVGLLIACNRLIGNDSLDKMQLLQQGIHIEQDVLKESVGYQDVSWAAAAEGLSYIRFAKNREININRIHLPGSSERDLADNLLMYYTGIKRVSSNIVATYKHKDQTENYRLAELGLDALYKGKFDVIGELLHKNWEIKKSQSEKSTNDIINKIYNHALEYGAIGGKLMGSGGGGTFVFYVPKQWQDKFRKAMSQWIEIKFNFYSNPSRIISN